MKYLKMFGLAALAAALMAFAAVGTASATTLDDAGGTMENGDPITAVSEGTTTLHPPIGEIKCEESHVGGIVTFAHHVKGNITSLSWSKCNAIVSPIKDPNGNYGSLTIEHTSGNDGILYGTGQKVTVVLSGFHCIFETSNTKLGTVTGSNTTGGHATLDIEATIPRTGGSSGFFCGSTAQWTGSYTVTNPSTLNVTS